MDGIKIAVDQSNYGGGSQGDVGCLIIQNDKLLIMFRSILFNENTHQKYLFKSRKA